MEETDDHSAALEDLAARSSLGEGGNLLQLPGYQTLLPVGAGSWLKPGAASIPEDILDKLKISDDKLASPDLPACRTNIPSGSGMLVT